MEPRWWPREGDRPDYRFTLANERTLLAYTRTALAALVAGIALIGSPLLTDGPVWLALVGLVPVAVGALVATAARRRGSCCSPTRATRCTAPRTGCCSCARWSAGSPGTCWTWASRRPSGWASQRLNDSMTCRPSWVPTTNV